MRWPELAGTSCHASTRCNNTKSIFFSLIHVVAVLGFASVATFAVHFSSKSNARLKEERLTSVEGLNRIFAKRYARELAEGDEWFNSVWKRYVGRI